MVLKGVVLSVVLLAPLALSACSPSPVALVGLTGSESSPSFVAYICKDEVRVTATVHEGSRSLFALYGHLPKERFTRVSMAPVNVGWTVSGGELRPLPDHTYTLELSNGEDAYLGASVDFTTRDLQEIGNRILIDHNGERKIVNQKDFVKEAEGRC